MTKKIISVAVLVMMMMALLAGDYYGVLKKGRSEEEKLYEDALIIWYADSNYAEYLRDAAVSYEYETGVKVIPVEVSDVQLLEQVQKSSVDGIVAPDLFVMSNESLEKGVLSGICGELRDPKRVLNSAFYTDASLRAVSYRDKFYGYPLSYETSCLVYNKTAMEQIVSTVIAKEEAGESNVEDTEGITVVEENVAVPEIKDLSEYDKLVLDAKAKEILPTSIVGILDFANAYSLPSDVENYFLWDTKDVLYNYWFAGACLDVGGENADRNEEINIYNENAMYSLEVYQDFRNFFSMDEDSVSYEETIKQFKGRKCLFTVAGTDIVQKLEKAKADGTFADEYDILPIGMLNGTLQSRPLSVTTMICVNGLGEHKSDAEQFAAFATHEYATNLYARCGKMTASHLEEYPYPQMEAIEDCYERSVFLPKMVETTNYYILAEMCFCNIWDGKDVNDELRSLSESILKNYYGRDFVHEKIETPQVTENYNAEDEN
ncbi:MAG: extracellular solute-binding protein [Lachnospiraceae bacterium]|nr:extracellular solute-binding protein [Lachnospiraceae bacterium]